MASGARLGRWIAATVVAAGLGGAPPAAAQARVSFPSFEDRIPGQAPTRIDGFLYRPDGDAPHPALVLMHGCGGLVAGDDPEAPRPFYDAWARRLAGLGYLVLAVDSYTPRADREGCEWWLPSGTPWVERPHDAYGALLYLQSRPDVRLDRIGLLGWAAGGGAVLGTIYAYSQARPRDLPHGDFRAAVALAPRACDRRLPFWRNVVPLLVVRGDADRWLPPDACEVTLEAAAEQGAPIETVARTHAGMVTPAAAGPRIGGPAFRRIEAFLAARLAE